MTTDPPSLKPLRPARPDIKLPARSPNVESIPLLQKRPPALTFSDGLNFGCGFWIAGGILFGALGFGLFMLGILSRLN